MVRVLGAVRGAWEGGDTTQLQRLISAGEDVNVCDETGHCASPFLPFLPCACLTRMLCQRRCTRRHDGDTNR